MTKIDIYEDVSVIEITAQGIQGPKGDKGDGAATVTVGTTTTGAAGTNASVTNSGTVNNVVLNFTVPQGLKGDKGDAGEQGLQGLQGLKGDQGDKGDDGLQGLKGDTGDDGIIAQTTAPTNTDVLWLDTDAVASTPATISVTNPITNTGTSSAAIIGVAAGSTSAAGVLQLTDSTSSTSTTTAATPNAVKSAYDIGFTKMLDWLSGRYYRTLIAGSNITATANTTYYTPLIVPSTTTIDRIGILTQSTFSGTASIRFGIYSNTNSAPDQLILDAGTVSATTANVFYQITINQTLSAGIYWLAANTQTAATTNAYVGVTGSTTIGYLGLPLNANNANYYAAGYTQAGVTGAFANASSPVLNQTLITPVIRKA